MIEVLFVYSIIENMKVIYLLREHFGEDTKQILIFLNLQNIDMVATFNVEVKHLFRKVNRNTNTKKVKVKKVDKDTKINLNTHSNIKNYGLNLNHI